MSIAPNSTFAHDRNTVAAGRYTRIAETNAGDEPGLQGTEAPLLLWAALDQLRLEGAIFFRAEFTEGFAFESTPAAVASLLHPGAERLILFHIVAQGSCWVSGREGDRHWAQPGDVIVVPYGDDHTIGGQAPAERVSILNLLDPPPWRVMPSLRHGGGGARTDLVCGYLYSEDPLFDPVMAAFPTAFVVRLPPGPSADWVQASIRYSLEESRPSKNSGSVLSTRLPELVLIEVLKFHLATTPAANTGWLAALHDPVLAPALSLLHGAPQRRWTVTDLARGATVSRSLLDERFRRVLGRSPIRYLAEWRMHLAEELLTSTTTSVVGVARRVGYDSEEAFSRAFRRAHGLSPSNWRVIRRGVDNPPTLR